MGRAKQIPSKIPSNLRSILAIGLTKLLVEVPLLAQHDTDMHDDDERDEYNDPPPCIEREREAEKDERQGEIERVAGVTKRT